MRLGLSVGRGAQEPQRESVNLVGLVNYCRAEADTSWMVAGSNVHSLLRECTGSVGVRRSGECAMVLLVYLGGLMVSVRYGN